MDGEDRATVKEIIGHKDIAMTMRYAHLAPDHKKKAMERLGVIFSMDTYMDTKANLPQKKGLASRRGDLNPHRDYSPLDPESSASANSATSASAIGLN